MRNHRTGRRDNVCEVCGGETNARGIFACRCRSTSNALWLNDTRKKRCTSSAALQHEGLTKRKVVPEVIGPTIVSAGTAAGVNAAKVS